MKVQKYFMRTRMHGTPTGLQDYSYSNKMCLCNFIYDLT